MGRSLVADGVFDAALIDANLAGERVDELAVVLARKGVPFAFVTGYGRDALPDGFGETALLSKPFTPDRLLAVVEGLLGVAGGTGPWGSESRMASRG